MAKKQPSPDLPVLPVCPHLSVKFRGRGGPMGGDITVENSLNDATPSEYPGTKDQIESHVKAYGCSCAVVLKPKNNAVINCGAVDGVCIKTGEPIEVGDDE